MINEALKLGLHRGSPGGDLRHFDDQIAVVQGDCA